MSDKDDKARFWAAVEDPDPSSMEVAQDIALEHNWKLWQLAEEHADSEAIWWGHSTRSKEWESVGGFWFYAGEIRDKRVGVTPNGAEWKITLPSKQSRGSRRAITNYVIEMFFDYFGSGTVADHEQWQWESSGIYPTIYEARRAAARYAWYALKVMKQGWADGATAKAVKALIEARQVDEVIPELNPSPIGEEDPNIATVMQILRDPQGGENAVSVAQDFMLEHDMKLQDVGESLATMMPAIKDDVADPSFDSVGAFPAQFGTNGYFDGAYWLAWKSSTGKKWLIKIYVLYQGEQWNTEGTEPSNIRYDTLREARIRASQEAWHIVKLMRRTMNGRGGFTHTPRAFEAYVKAQPIWSHRPLPKELNPMRNKNPSDLAAARDKYKEFHRYDPKDVGEFPSSFTIPKRMLLAGKAKWVTYRSSKVDPSTLEKPKRPIDYIHEHDAGVCTYIKDADADTDVPEKFRDVGALVKLGECLGFCVVDGDGQEVEAEGTKPLPELYTTPDGKCLFVIQGKREVLAMSWGGALGVFARGIDG